MVAKININVLISPLDWGLGHATRCIPLISHLLRLGCNVIIATDGPQEQLLKTEFPQLQFSTLAGYRIQYANNKRFFALKIISQLPKILTTAKREKKWLSSFVERQKVDLIISDNRYGFYHPVIPSIFITHQLLVKAPFSFAEKIIRFFNYRFIRNFKYCLVPDQPGDLNIAGLLSHPTKMPVIPVRYIGGLSRLEKIKISEIRYQLLILLSGPEPQRTQLEKKLLKQLERFDGYCLFVRGLPGEKVNLAASENVTVINHLPAKQLEVAMAESELMISRSGYTTVMDICKVGIHSILIPTSGQTEQEYLAKHLQQQGWCMAATEDLQLKDLLASAKNFPFKLPSLNMELYKEAIEEIIGKIQSNKTG